MKRLAVIGALAIAAMLGLSSSSSAWTEEDCKKQPSHPDCVKFHTPSPTPKSTPTSAPTEAPRIPPTRPPFTVAPSPTLIPPVTTTPQPTVQGVTTLPNTSTR